MGARIESALWMQPAHLASGVDVRLITEARGQPRTIKSDNGSELFISKVMDKWAYERGLELEFSRPGNPTNNANVESFNGRLRQKCLNAIWFMSLDDARDKIEAWLTYYTQSHSYSALDWATLAELARRGWLQPATAMATEPEITISEQYLIGYGVTKLWGYFCNGGRQQ